jgi:hypothetical protein
MGSRRARFTLSGAALAAMVLGSSMAEAQVSPADRETARSMMAEGRDLRDKNDLKGALQKFKAADDIMHVPTTALEVARTQAALGLLVEALDTVEGIRKTPVKPDDPQPFKDAHAKADDLDTQIEAKVPSVTITVTGAAEGDSPAVSVDGASLPAGAIGVARKIDPGHHVITAHAASGDAKEEIDVAEGDKKEVALTLSAGEKAPEGGGADEAAKGDIVHTPSALTWAGVGVGGAGLVVGAITGLMTLSKASTVKDECHNMVCGPGGPSSDLSSANSLATISTVGFIVAAAGAGVAVVSLIVGHKKSDAAPASAPPPDSDAPAGAPESDATPPAPQSKLEVIPWIGPGSAGVFGTF